MIGLLQYALTERRTHLLRNRGLNTLCGVSVERGKIKRLLALSSNTDWLPPECNNCMAVRKSLEAQEAYERRPM